MFITSIAKTDLQHGRNTALAYTYLYDHTELVKTCNLYDFCQNSQTLQHASSIRFLVL